MKPTLLLLALITCFYTQGFSQTWQWTHPEPNGNLSPNSEHDNPHDVEIDTSGNVYVLGDYLDSLFLNNIYRTAGSGSYLAKYDSTGNLLWYKLIRPTGTPKGGIQATDLTVTPQGVFITGKFTATDDVESPFSYGIGAYTFASGINDIGVFVAKLNSNGGIVWNRLVTGQKCFNDVCYSVDNISFNPLITSDKSGNIICEFLYQNINPDLTSLSVGTGNIPVPPPTVTEAYAFIICKMNNAGTLQWSNYAYNANQVNAGNNCNSIITDKNGNVFLYGNANDSCAFGSNIFHTTQYLKDSSTSFSTFIAKISSAGAWQFVKELCNSSQNHLELGIGNPDFMATDNNNNVYALVNIRGNGIYGVVTGDTVPSDKTNTYIVKLTSSGSLVWHKGFATNDTYANSIYFANNALYICGGLRNYTYADKKWYFSALTVQPTSPDYSGSHEYFVSKANTTGDFQWVTSFSSPYNFMVGFSVKAFKDNVYTSGAYRNYIATLGNLNGTYTDINGTHNIFFGKLKDQYVRIGTVAPTSLIPGCTIMVPFTSTGLIFSPGNTFTAELSDVNGAFTSPTAIGAFTSTGTGMITATIPASLTYSSGYRVRVRSSDTLPTGYNYYTYADTQYVLSLVCPAPSAGFSATNITANSATVNWTAVGCASAYKVQYRVKGTTTWTTVNINGNNATLNITSLTANTVYQWRVATKCKNNGTNSFSAYSKIKEFTTAAAFASAIATNDLNISTTSFTIYPNPARDKGTLVFSAVKAGNSTIEISDVAGRIVFHSSLASAIGENKHTIDISRLAQGMYLVTLTHADQSKQTLALNKE